ncbi:hypothetical protein [Burkholderia glumae]
MEFTYQSERAINMALKRFRDRLESRFPDLVDLFGKNDKDVFARTVSDVCWQDLKRGCSEASPSRFDEECTSSELIDRHVDQYWRFRDECAKFGRHFLDTTPLTAFICDAHLTARNLPQAGEHQGALDTPGHLWVCVHELHKYKSNPELVPTAAVVEMFRVHSLNGEPENRANVQQSVFTIASQLTWNDKPDARKMSARLFEALRDCGKRHATLQLAKLLADGIPKKNHQQAMRMANELLATDPPFAEDWANAELHMLAGTLKLIGEDGTRDERNAVAHFKKAALLGDVNAARLLARLYAKPQTTRKTAMPQLVKPSFVVSDAYGRLAGLLMRGRPHRQSAGEE